MEKVIASFVCVQKLCADQKLHRRNNFQLRFTFEAAQRSWGSVVKLLLSICKECIVTSLGLETQLNDNVRPDLENLSAKP